jgi:hypothetical protein
MQKHKLATRSLIDQSGEVSYYLFALDPTENDFLLAIREATFVYLIISFRSVLYIGVDS